jgi:hypothetical protein
VTIILAPGLGPVRITRFASIWAAPSRILRSPIPSLFSRRVSGIPDRFLSFAENSGANTRKPNWRINELIFTYFFGKLMTPEGRGKAGRVAGIERCLRVGVAARVTVEMIERSYANASKLRAFPPHQEQLTARDLAPKCSIQCSWCSCVCGEAVRRGSSRLRLVRPCIGRGNRTVPPACPGSEPVTHRSAHEIANTQPPSCRRG